MILEEKWGLFDNHIYRQVELGYHHLRRPEIRIVKKNDCNVMLHERGKREYQNLIWVMFEVYWPKI